MSDSGSALLMGLDLGTSAIKGVVIDAAGAELCSCEFPVRLDRPREGWVELDAEQHYRTVCQVIGDLSRCAARPVAGVAMSAASGNTLLADSAGQPLTRIISWMDQRCTQRLPARLRSLDAESVHRTTGWPCVDTFPLAHLAWFQENLPHLYATAARYCLSADWLLHRLTGNWVMDHSVATTFHLQDQVTRAYHTPYLELLGIPEEKLSQLVPSGSPVGSITVEAAADTGLEAGTPVFAGSFDHPSAALAAGVLDAGSLMLSCGTSWVGFFPEQDRQVVVDAGLLCDPFLSGTGGPWGAMFSVPHIGQAIDWYVHNVIAPDSDDPFMLFDEAASAAAPGAGGLEIDLREPPGHVSADRPNVSRAVMENAAKLVRAELVRLETRAITFNRAVMVGGAVNSPTWRRIVEETIGIPVAAGSRHSGATGAALLAGIGAGIYGDAASAYRATRGPG